MWFPPINLWSFPKQLRDYYMDKQDEISATLQERGNRYGPFDGHAMITQALKEIMAGSVDGIDTNWNTLTPDQKEALEMIVHKIGRILNGDPNYDDSWIDIAGYAKLVADKLRIDYASK